VLSRKLLCTSLETSHLSPEKRAKQKRGRKRRCPANSQQIKGQSYLDHYNNTGPPRRRYPTIQMVSIRNGSTHNRKSRSPFWLAQLPQIVTFFLVANVCFYFGVLVGMNLSVHKTYEASRATAGTSDEIEAEVMRRTKLREEEKNSIGISDNKDNDDKDNNARQRRFPKTVSKFAYGSVLIEKNEFIQNFDYGIPKPPSKREYEKDPGKDDVLLLYGSRKSLPDISTGVVSGGGDIPRMSALVATKNCAVLNVIYTDTHGGEDVCTAIVGNYESYHIQRCLRFDGTRVDRSIPFRAVGRGMQVNGQDKFEAPSDNYALQNQALLETYFDRLEDTIEALTPMAESCASDDNTVIVMVCNTGQSDLLINFFCSADARGFGDVVRKKVLIFATDEGVLEIAKGLGVNAFYDEKVSVFSV